MRTLSIIFSAFTFVIAHAEPYVTVQNKDYLSGTSASEWAQYTLDTGGAVIVRTGANISFTAGNRIVLYPGFRAEAGSAFQASVSAIPRYNPGGYYNTISPTLALVSGNQQYGQAGQFNGQPFDIAIWNEAGTAPLVNAPVLITVNYGGGWLATTNDLNAPLSKTLHLTTDSDGTIRVYFQHGLTELVSSEIRVVAGNETYLFTTFSYSTSGPNADIDGDGISDSAEAVLGTNPNQPAQVGSLGLSIFSP